MPDRPRRGSRVLPIALVVAASALRVPALMEQVLPFTVLLAIVGCALGGLVTLLHDHAGSGPEMRNST